MINILGYFFLLIGAFYILIKSADYLLKSSSVLGQRAGLSKFTIGLTIVAIGTSLPELFTAITGVLFSQNTDSFVIGTIMGSNISNILLIFGLLILFSTKFKSNTKIKDILMLTFSTLTLLTLIYFGKLTFLIGMLFLGIYISYIYFDIMKKRKIVEKEIEENIDSNLSQKSNLIIYLILTISLVGLNIASKAVVYGIDNLGILINIPSTYLTLTTVALATSLPEAIVTYESAKLKEFDLAIGNIIGSNISNVFMIIGVVSIFKQFSFNFSVYIFSSIFLVIATTLFIFYLKKKKINNFHGILLIIIYLIYIIGIFLI